MINLDPILKKVEINELGGLADKFIKFNKNHEIKMVSNLRINLTLGSKNVLMF